MNHRNSNVPHIHGEDHVFQLGSNSHQIPRAMNSTTTADPTNELIAASWLGFMAIGYPSQGRAVLLFRATPLLIGAINA